jgi:hypothetical protein
MGDVIEGTPAWNEGDGWMPWHLPISAPSVPRPDDYAEVWIMRAGWDAPRRCSPGDLHPMMNVAGLYYLPVGGWSGRTLRTGRNVYAVSDLSEPNQRSVALLRQE